MNEAFVPRLFQFLDDDSDNKMIEFTPNENNVHFKVLVLYFDLPLPAPVIITDLFLKASSNDIFA